VLSNFPSFFERANERQKNITDLKPRLTKNFDLRRHAVNYGSMVYPFQTSIHFKNTNLTGQKNNNNNKTRAWLSNLLENGQLN